MIALPSSRPAIHAFDRMRERRGCRRRACAWTDLSGVTRRPEQRAAVTPVWVRRSALEGQYAWASDAGLRALGRLDLRIARDAVTRQFRVAAVEGPISKAPEQGDDDDDENQCSHYVCPLLFSDICTVAYRNDRVCSSGSDPMPSALVRTRVSGPLGSDVTASPDGMRPNSWL